VRRGVNGHVDADYQQAVPLYLENIKISFLLSRPPHPRRSTLFPYTTLFRSPDLLRGPRRLDEAQPIAARSVRTEPRLAGLRQDRSEEHTSELQSRSDLVCRLLLEKKKKK